MGITTSRLEDRLYDKVMLLLPDDDKQYAPSITGMLLEMGEQSIQNLFKSDHLLKQAVEKSLKAYVSKQEEHKDIPGCSGQSVGTAIPDKAAVGDTLYEKVERLCPDHAARITGMLLEMDRPSLEKLLVTDALLQSAVKRAEQVCISKHKKTHTADEDQTQSVGDLLYDKVEKIYPDHAAKITGMMLEQPTDKVQQILQNEEQLLLCIRRAYDTLQYEDT